MSETQEFDEGMADQFEEGFDLDDERATEKGQTDANPEGDQLSAEPDSRQEQPEPVQQSGNTTAQQPDNIPIQQDGQLETPPENIADEWATLNKLNPEAARLALEDSAEGEAIRNRLEHYGAEQAQDRAEMILYRRNQEQAAIDAHNKRFKETIQKNHPEYFAMISDPSRKAEAAQYFKSVLDWIAQKPYAEAQKMIEIAQCGRDPEQVCALISRYEKEKGATAKKPDATGAYAVPSRGAPVAPAGVGDKDDFDAGWNMNQ